MRTSKKASSISYGGQRASARQLTKQAGLSKGRVSRIENGAVDPRATTLVELAPCVRGSSAKSRGSVASLRLNSLFLIGGVGRGCDGSLMSKPNFIVSPWGNRQRVRIQ